MTPASLRPVRLPPLLAGALLLLLAGPLRAQTCTYVLTPDTIQIGASGGARTVTVTSTPGCAWAAQTTASWIAITNGQGGGSGTFTLTMSANTTGAARTGTVTVGTGAAGNGRTVTVTQSAPSCTYAVAPTSASFPYTGGTGSIAVTAPAGCPWTARAGGSWITITAGASGSGTGTVSYTVAANPDDSARNEDIEIVDLAIRIQQAPAPSCSYAINPTVATFGANGGTGQVAVTSAAGCPWTARPDSSWITVTSGASGSGNGTVAYTVAPNTASSGGSAQSRSGEIEIGGKKLRITQSAPATCSYSISPTSASLPASGGTGTISVAASANSCPWTAFAEDSWLTVPAASASGTGNGQVTWSAAANPGEPRTGKIRVAGKTFNVSQAGSTCGYSVSPLFAAFGSSGGSGTLNIQTSSSCSWTASTAETWITLSPAGAGGGTGNGSVSFTVAANTGALRTGTLTVARQTVTVTQAGAGCAYAVTPFSVSLPAAGGTAPVTVTASGGCPWSASSTASWLSTSPASGTGSGSVNLIAPANTGSSRSGLAVVAGQQVTVRQDGAGCAPQSAPLLLSPAAQATDIPLSVKFTWSAVPEADDYDLLLDTVTPPSKRAARGVDHTSYVVSNLAAGTTYYWRVVAFGDDDCYSGPGLASDVRSFTTRAGCTAPAAPTPVAPASGATVQAPVTLSWQAAAGAGTYDVYLGSASAASTSNAALTRVAAGLTTTSFAVTTLVTGTTYAWLVVAHASCDPTKVVSSRTSTFTVAGSCAPAGTATTVAPPSGATGVSAPLTLTWGFSANASSYDLFFGRTNPPPLYQRGLTQTSTVVSSLENGATYHWQVRANVACDPTKSTTSAIARFTVKSECETPAAPVLSLVPPGNVSAGQAYAISWTPAAGVGSQGGYLVERATNPAFSPLLDSQRLAGTSASFLAAGEGTYVHRVRAFPGCDPGRLSLPSEVATVNVVGAPPNVVFTVAPQAVITAPGEALESRSTRFVVENISEGALQVQLGQTVTGPAFFQILDAAGTVPSVITLEPGVPASFQVRFFGPSPDVPASFDGLIFLTGVESPLPVTPYAYVSLKVAGSDAPAPRILVGGLPAESVAFPPFSGDDTERPPLQIAVQNTGTVAADLAAEIGPEVWLELDPLWNAEPLGPGEVRPVLLVTRRNRAPAGSGLPRATFVTFRTRGGATSRLLVEDRDVVDSSATRSTSLDPGVPSYVVPSIVHATSVVGHTFVSTVTLSNASDVPAQTELILTPAGADGFDAERVRSVTLSVPANDVVRLSDPVVSLFGLEPPLAGQLEVRAAPETIGLLTVTSGVEAASETGGAFGLMVPVFRRGEGARLGAPHFISGVTSTETRRTNLILAETTGTDGAVVHVALSDASGTPVGETTLDVPRYGQRQVSGLVDQLKGGRIEGGRVDLTVQSGGGTVAALITVIDNVTDDASTRVSEPAPVEAGPAAGMLAALRAIFPWPGDDPAPGSLRVAVPSSIRYVIPSVVNGFQTFPGTDLPYTFQSRLWFTSGTLQSASFALSYTDLVGGQTYTQTVTAPPRGTLTFANALEQIFGLPAGARSHGPLFVDAPLNGTLGCEVFSILGDGTLGDGFPVVAIPSAALTGASSTTPLYVDGLEQSVDRSRGSRSNLILNEVSGRPATVIVRLYEPSNRTQAISEAEVSLLAYEKKQLSTVFSSLDLDSEDRRKDRVSVLCVVTPSTEAGAGDGLVTAVVTTIDNQTGDTRNILLTPAGGVASAPTGVIGF